MEEQRGRGYSPRAHKNGTMSNKRNGSNNSAEKIDINVSSFSQPRYQTKFISQPRKFSMLISARTNGSSNRQVNSPCMTSVQRHQFTDMERVNQGHATKSTQVSDGRSCVSPSLRPVYLPENSRWAIIDEEGRATPLPPGCIPATCCYKNNTPATPKVRNHGNSGRYVSQEILQRSPEQAPEVMEKNISFFKRRLQLNRQRNAVTHKQPDNMKNPPDKTPVDQRQNGPLYSLEEFLKLCDENDDEKTEVYRIASNVLST